MKFQLEDHQDNNFISNYDSESVVVSEKTYRGSLLISTTNITQDWALKKIEDFTEKDCLFIANQNSEIILLGSQSSIASIDARHRFWFANHGMGLEVMNIGAACRTYNILAAEGRSVLAALIFP